MNWLPVDPVLIIALVVLLGWFTIALWRFWRKSLFLIEDLSGFIAAVSTTPPSQDDAGLDASIRADSELSVVWRRLKASRFKSNAERLVLAHEPADLLTADDILDATKDFRFWSATPNYLVGLGLGFTFLGLVLALNSIDATNLSDPKQLTRLFAAMKFKFIASMTGIFSSIAFSWFLRRRIGVIHRLCAELQAALATRYPVVDPVVNAVEALGMRVEAVEARVGQSVAIGERTATATERSIGIWGDVVDRLDTAATQLKKFNDELSISIGNVLEQRFEQKLLPPLNEALKSLERAVHSVRDAQTSADSQMMTGVVEEFRKAVTGGTSNEVTAITATLAQLNASLGATKADFDGVGKTIESTIVTGLKAATTQLSDSIESLSQRLAETLNVASGSLTARLNTASTDAGDRFTTAVDRLDGLLQQATGTVSAAKSSTDSVERVIAGFAVVAEKLNEAQVGFGRIADPIQRASETLDAVADRVRQAAESIDRSAQASHSTAERVSASWTQASQRFETVDKDLAKIFSDLDQGLTSYAATVNDFNGKLTSEFTRALGSLQGIVGELDETLQEMQTQVGRVVK